MVVVALVEEELLEGVLVEAGDDNDDDAFECFHTFLISIPHCCVADIISLRGSCILIPLSIPLVR